MKESTTTPDRIDDYFNVILDQLRENMQVRQDDILKAWHENIAQANANEKKFPPLKLSISATVDLEENTIATTLKFSAIYTSTIGGEIPDPDQLQLPLGAEDAP